MFTKNIKVSCKIILAIAVVFCIISGSLLLTCCSVDKPARLNIVCTIFASYDWARNLTKGIDDVKITMLLDNGVDLHSYQPSVQNIADISTCDLFVYVGGESDSWVEGALQNAQNPNRKVVNLIEVLGDNVKEEEIVEGMQGEEGDEGGDEGEVEYDEHVWLSLKNAKVCCQNICQALMSIDAQNSNTYQNNLTNYCAKLDELDGAYLQAVNGAAKNTVLFADRFPFRYLVDDYNLNYYAAFVGCSAESEASFETVVFLSQKVDELSLKAVLVTESNNTLIAQTVISNTTNKNQQILVMDSMQSITSQKVQQGANYLQIMQNNLAVLIQALQ